MVMASEIVNVSAFIYLFLKDGRGDSQFTAYGEESNERI